MLWSPAEDFKYMKAMNIILTIFPSQYYRRIIYKNYLV